MTLLQLVAVEGEVVNGPLRFRANENQENRMAEEDGIDRQLRQMETMARQLFPDDETAAAKHENTLLRQRVRELWHRMAPLQVRDEMTHDPRP